VPSKDFGGVIGKLNQSVFTFRSTLIPIVFVRTSIMNIFICVITHRLKYIFNVGEINAAYPVDAVYYDAAYYTRCSPVVEK
jgi:hypothetical protein